MRRLLALALVALGSTGALPAPGTCGPWVPQPDMTQWRMCTDTQNNQYCEFRDGGRITRIECP
jgi:hypothetical protein